MPPDSNYNSGNINDAKLTFDIKNNSREAFRLLFEKYHAKVYNVSRRMGVSQEDSEGIVQDVFLTIWEKREHLDEELSINAFIITIAKRLVYKKVRKNIAQQAHLLDTKHSNSTWSNETEDYIIFSELDQLAQEGIDNLPDNRKQIFMLSREHGLSNDEIAEKLKISKRTVENQLYRATRALREHIDKSRSS